MAKPDNCLKSEVLCRRNFSVIFERNCTDFSQTSRTLIYKQLCDKKISKKARNVPATKTCIYSIQDDLAELCLPCILKSLQYIRIYKMK